MNINYKKIKVIMAAIFIATGISAQTPQMVKDINTTVNGGFAGSDPSAGVVMGTNLYFTATDRATGTELWKTDGTVAGTMMVKDIYTGATGSNPVNLVVLGSMLYFSANNGVNGAELWKTDGTAAGTTMVQDIYTGSIGSAPGDLVALGGFVYFSATDNTHGNELWKTNGTTTSLVADIQPGTASSSPASLTAFGSVVVFSADDGTTSNEIWTSNGTTTSLLKDIEPLTGSSSPGKFCVNGTNIYFSATTSTYGTEPWVSDGTAAGTHLLSDVSPGNDNTYIVEFRTLGAGTLISLISNSGSVGNEWYITTGTTVSLVKNINPNPGYGGLSGQNGYEFGGYVYFGADDATGQGTELWRTDGTPTGTTMVKDIWPGGDGYPYNFSKSSLNGFIYFCANNGTDGPELWKTDGTAAGTTQLKNICFGNNGAFPDNFSLLGTQFIFSANNDSLSGANNELWKTDGTGAGTTLLKNIYRDTITTADGFQHGIGVNNSTLIFSAQQDSIGTELYISNGTNAGTQFLKDINAGMNSSNPDQFTTIGPVTFFSADDGIHGQELWKTDGTLLGTVLVKDINSGSGSNANNFKAMGSFLYFSADDGPNGSELWRSDGTPAGTTMVMNINPGSSSDPYPLAVSGSFLYFTADDGIHGNELWKTDGTTTTLVMDINVGSGSSYPDGEGVQVLGGYLYFTADNGTTTNVWKTNGTTTTSLGVESGGSDFTVLVNKLYFSGNNAATGNELWYTDGTTTAMIKDISVGNNYSNPEQFTVSGNAVYFIADDGIVGEELWKTDGTAAGTILVKDVRPGSSNSNINSLTAFSGRLYFSAYDGITGTELWQSDGTAANTISLDVQPGSNSSYPDYFANMNGTLYFGAQTILNGLELWKLTPSNFISTSAVAPSYCPGKALMVPFTAYGAINAGNVYTAQLSDATGSFSSPVTIGTLTSTTLTGSVNATIPVVAAAGTAYRVRVTASNVSTTGNDNGANLTVNTLPVLTALASATTICTGNSATLTVSGANTYTWSTTANTASVIVSPTANITYSVTGINTAGCTNTASISMIVNTCTGINEAGSHSNGIRVYPNPSGSLVNVDVETLTNEEALIEFTNTLGQVVLSEKAGNLHSSFNIQQLNAGIYLIKITVAGKASVTRFIKE